MHESSFRKYLIALTKVVSAAGLSAACLPRGECTYKESFIFAFRVLGR
jgi:hypothetical protein